MRRFLGLAALAAAAIFVQGIPAASAGIVSVSTPWASGNTNADPSTNLVNSQTLDVTANGNDWGNSADGLTVTTNGDPNLFIFNSLDNDTSFTWTSYNVSVELATPFTLSNYNWFGTATPAAWTPPVIDGPEFFNGTQYEQDLTYTGGAATVPIGGNFSFGYEVSFAASGSFAFTQVLSPAVPEPASFGILIVGGLGVLARRRRSRLA